MKVCCSLLLASLAELGTQDDSCLSGKQDACFSLMSAMTDDSCAANKLWSRDHKIGAYWLYWIRWERETTRRKNICKARGNLKRGRSFSPSPMMSRGGNWDTECCFCREGAPIFSGHWGSLLWDRRGWKASALQRGSDQRPAQL